MGLGLAINPDIWDDLTFKPDTPSDSRAPIQYDWAVRYTRYIEKIANEHFRGVEPGIYKFACCTSEELADAVRWREIQDEIAEQQDTLEYCWSVDKSLRRRAATA